MPRARITTAQRRHQRQHQRRRRRVGPALRALRLYRHLCRRLQCALLRTRIAQLNLVTSVMPVASARDAMWQAALWGRKADAQCKLYQLERQA